MKLEKLTENKIRIIMNLEDFDIEHEDLHSIMKNAIENQDIFYKILKKAENELSFYTDGCKLLIEAFFSVEDNIIFTITKYNISENEDKSISNKKRKPIVRRKQPNILSKQLVYGFNSFDDFCEFCYCIVNCKNFNMKNFSKNTVLYLYNNTYYLIIKNVNVSYAQCSTFYLIGSEFAKLLPYSELFENKLVEHGEIIIKRDTINTGAKIFR